MRLWRITLNDVRYQIRYGFYLIYAILTLLYALVLNLIGDAQARGLAAALILLSDPAVLGFFFIGGIWLLEKDEDLHSYATITPQRSAEYVLGKALSLGLVSTLSSTAIGLAALPGANLLLLAAAVLLASGVFTLLGLALATWAKSVNGYMLLSVVPAVVLLTPAILTAFGVEHFLFEGFPGTLALRLILDALAGTRPAGQVALGFAELLGWLAVFFALATRAVRREFHPKPDMGGHTDAANP